MPRRRKKERGSLTVNIPEDLVRLIEIALKDKVAGYTGPAEFVRAAVRDKLKALGLLPPEA